MRGVQEASVQRKHATLFIFLKNLHRVQGENGLRSSQGPDLPGPSTGFWFKIRDIKRRNGFDLIPQKGTTLIMK